MKNILPYNQKQAVTYAYEYAFKRNPAFSDFTQIGGNCTNFVSQCLHAGEAPMNFSYPFGWYYKSLNNRSPSFTGVEYLYSFLTRLDYTKGPFAKAVAVEDAELGDIIQLSFDGESFGHSLLVTKLNPKNPSNPYLTTNTFDALDKPLKEYVYVDVRALHVMGAR